MTDEPANDVTPTKRRLVSTTAPMPDLSGIEFPITVAKVQKNKREFLILQFAPWGKSLLLNGRIWYLKDGELRPTKDGWAIQAALADEVFDAFAKARKIAYEHGWLKQKEAPK